MNHLKQEEFVRVIGPVFEHSPWIAEATWTKRPFANLENLHASLCETVAQLDESKKLDLLRAHPDLVGRAALAGTLTSASAREQASAGLDRLTPQEIALFQQHNREYWKKFGFPFVICARLNKKEAILAGFTPRLQHSCAQEIETALVEIGKIAWLRLQDLIKI
ncbi:MAG TPA: 2-oxo-4-hydroxy-4-carboxy-5-ureidoimidazoline decarboxylase [Candidatus Binatia bacterium]|nr:2-oxo-4-hydroxy-4-carboxy-5-ureidoimidazoline decarboxylase [Candidatus Binatia bacterium]